MISRTKIKFRTRKKTSPEIIETINAALKNKAWHRVAQIISNSTKKYSSVNLSKIDKGTKAGDTIIILGKVLSSGNLTKKIRICALSFSSQTLEKLKESKSESVSILEEIKINPKAQGIKIIQ